ncbi:type II secretion system F family protein [Altererythrobacter aquiaggeris]|uniref:type II secretion system F family protein n=1 Tax=Aestuarierythrobacter aquiaggeris TaxID=1898396 RepID=UPI00301A15E0
MLEFLATNEFARLAALALVFALVLGVVVLVSRTFVRRAEIKAGLQTIARPEHAAGRSRLQEQKEGAWSQLADTIEKAGLNLTDSRADELRDKLVAAGYTSPNAPKLFTLARLGMLIILPLVYLAIATAGAEPVSGFKLYGYSLLLAVAGLYLPNLFVSAKADRRREAITNGFPDCLDLMLVCVEAGLGLEAAMDRVGREMVNTHPLVARLLSTATLQLRAGAQREEALRKMGELSGVSEIKSFATLLIQSDKLGTSISDTLRVYASEMREKRRMRAEEKAHRLPVLISIPLVVCMLPTMVGVLMLPGVIRTIRQLLPAMGGG